MVRKLKGAVKILNMKVRKYENYCWDNCDYKPQLRCEINFMIVLHYTLNCKDCLSVLDLKLNLLEFIFIVCKTFSLAPDEHELVSE